MKIIFRVALGLVILITAMSVVGSAASAHWIGELFAQPRPQYVIGLVLCGVPIIWRYPRSGWWVVIPILLNAYYLSTLYFTPPLMIVPGGEQISLVHANVDRFNADPHSAFDWLRKQNATIISMQEVTPAFEKEFDSASLDYEIVLSHALTSSHGSAVLVRKDAALTKISAQIIHLPATSERPLIEYVFRVRDCEFALLSLCLSRPIWQQHFAYQSLELRETVNWARLQQEAGREVIIIGDLNLAPWSPRFGALCSDARLINSQAGFGLQATWPATLPRFVGLPIDHCLHSAGVETTLRTVGPSIGSDHRPICVTFKAKTAAAN